MPYKNPEDATKRNHQYYVENKEHVLNVNKKRRRRDPEKAKFEVRRSMLWVKYRLTPEDVTKIDEFQKTHSVFSILLGNRLSTDHDHKTGLIRGRLDWRINRAYGLIEKVNPDNTSKILRALADFHENPPATLALGEKRFGLIGLAQYKKKMIYGSEKGPMKAQKKRKQK